MKKIIKKGAKIERFTKSREDAIAYFQEKNEPYKVELIEDFLKAPKSLSIPRETGQTSAQVLTL